jgi:magnesium chelatase family protein
MAGEGRYTYYLRRPGHRDLQQARTIADLEGADAIAVNHLSEAVQYRRLDRNLFA